MNRLTLLASLTLGCSLALAGCDIQYTEGGANWGDDLDGGGTGPCPGGSHQGSGVGLWGDPCTTGADCAPGLGCDLVAWVCQPDPNDPQPCASDGTCSQGFVCDGGSGQCVPTAVCTNDAECAAGQLCDLGTSTCVPDPGPAACADVAGAQACIDRPDCEPVYAGVNCSCGPGCECAGGEPGCVCESFEFFKCEASGA